MSLQRLPQPVRGAKVLQEDGTFAEFWSGWFRTLFNAFNGNVAAGFSGTVALAKLTPSTGTNGSLTVVNGVITAYVAPT